MKVAELLTEAKKSKKKDQQRAEQKLDKVAMFRDYTRWKRLVNMPIKIVKSIASDDDYTDRGMTPKELQKSYGFNMPKSAARAIVKMRQLPFSQWTTIEINWMYRMLKYIDNKLATKRQFVSNNIPSEKLRDLWAWGHVPSGLKPTDKRFKEEKDEAK